MILAITANPSLDTQYQMPVFNLGDVHRTSQVSKTPGGKGLNVARIIKQLDENVQAAGFLGGFTGRQIHEALQHLSLPSSFTHIQGETRVCVAINDGEKQTEILEPGPYIRKSEKEEFLQQYINTLNQVNLVTISGSLPRGLDPSFYINIAQKASERNIPVLLDVHGALLKVLLQSNVVPYLLKPNLEEFQHLVGEHVERIPSIVRSLTDPMFKDIPWVIVSLGANGAVVKHEQQFFRVTLPHVEVKNPVGSGDAVIAGFAAGVQRGYGPERLITFAMATGMINAMEETTGYIDLENLKVSSQQINVSKLE